METWPGVAPGPAGKGRAVGALVVYESMFGNTEAVAEAVADGLRAVMDVEVLEVSRAPLLELLDDVDLLVVGAPTHAFGLSRPETRRDAAERVGHAVISDTTGMREWLAEAYSAPRDLPVACFDTHVRVPNLPGRAGHAAEKRLRRLGANVVGSPTSFYVHGYEGPLYAGEAERARAWGEELGSLVAGGTPVR